MAPERAFERAAPRGPQLPVGVAPKWTGARRARSDSGEVRNDNDRRRLRLHFFRRPRAAPVCRARRRAMVASGSPPPHGLADIPGLVRAPNGGGVSWTPDEDPSGSAAAGSGPAARAPPLGPRLGTLRTPRGSFPTPALLTYTRRGEPAFLTPDVLALLPATALAFQTSLVHFMDHLPPSHVGDCPGGGRAYSGCRPAFVLASARDPISFDLNAKPSNDARSTFVGTPVGVKKITLDEYAAWAEATQPDAFVALADELPCAAPAKKLAASVERATEWLVEQVERSAREPEKIPPVFASVQGGADERLRRRSAETAARLLSRGERAESSEDPPPGGDDASAREREREREHERERERERVAAAFRARVVGFSVGGLGTEEAPGAQREALLRASLEPLPARLPRHVAGLGAPQEALRLMALGVDLIDASFCHACTRQNLALCFPLDEPEEARGDGDGVSTKKRRRDAEDAPKTLLSDKDASEKDEKDASDALLLAGATPFAINLLATAHARDRAPFAPGCECFSCANHSRAYAHHLLQCHEMTAQVLIDAHNLHHYHAWFEAARRAMREKRFERFAEFHRARFAEEEDRE